MKATHVDSGTRQKGPSRERELSRVRFSTNGERHASPSRRKPLPPSPHHLYVPRLHRLRTELELPTQLGTALTTFTQHLGPELDPLARASAQLELSGILVKIFRSIASCNLDIQEPIYVSDGFTHWQKEPEKRVICYLPVRLSNVKVQTQGMGTAHMSIRNPFPSDLKLGEKFVSVKKFYAFMIKLISRALILKKVPKEAIHFTSTKKLLEISLSDTPGWVAEIVPCIMTDKKGELFCCRSFHIDNTVDIPKKINGALPNSSMKVSNLHATGDDKSLATKRSKPGEINENTRHNPSESKDGYKIVTSQSVETDVNNNHKNLNDSLKSQAIYIGTYNVSNTMVNDISRIPEQEKITVKAKTENNNTQTQAKDVQPGSHVNDKAVQKSELQTTENIPETKGERPDTLDVLDRSKNRGDITWYQCSPISENQLLHAISLTDSGVRTSAMLVVCRLCQADWRLRLVTAYHVQTALLHEADHALDATPRWQRNSLERCTKAILLKLQLFARSRRLPHFFLHDVDLWQGQSEDKLGLALSALDRLSSSDLALTSLACRAGGFSMTSDTDLGIYSNLISDRSEAKFKHLL